MQQPERTYWPRLQRGEGQFAVKDWAIGDLLFYIESGRFFVNP
jgi:hypothetical protein